MKKVCWAVVSWLLRIKINHTASLSDISQTILFTNGGTLWQAILLHLLLPEACIFVLPKKTCQRFSWFATHRRVLCSTNENIVINTIAFLRRQETVVLFPDAETDLFELCRCVSVLMCRTGATAYPVIVAGRGTRECWAGTFTGSGLVICAGEKQYPEDPRFSLRQAYCHKLFQSLQETLFWARYDKHTNLFDHLLAAARQFGAGKVVGKDPLGKLNYRTLILGSYILGKKIQGICKDEIRLGMLLPTSVGHLVALFALCYQGKTPVLLNFSSGIANVQDCAELSEVRSIITARSFIEKAGLEHMIAELSVKYRIIYLDDLKAAITLPEKLAGFIQYMFKQKARVVDDYRLILFTSGSENKPKGVVLSHRNLIANVDQLSCVFDFTTADKMLNALPMFHSFGLTGGALLPVFEGIEVYLYPSPLHYKIIPEIIDTEKVTILLGTPTFLFGYARNAEDVAFQSLRCVLAGGEKLKDEIREFWREKFGIHVLEAYGTTEASPGLCVSTHRFNKNGAVGKFLPGIKWRLEIVPGIEEGGKLLVKGPNIMEGYALYRAGFVPVEEWYDCGDVVAVDAEGYCTIKARLKRFAKISGEMVSLNQVEEAAEKCFNNPLNAAVSVFDDKRGEKIVLFTTNRAASRQQLREYLKQEQLSMLLLPTDVILLEEMPLLGNGKTDYVLLQEFAKE